MKKKRNLKYASSDEIDKMFESVRKALVGESIQEYSGEGFDTNAITEFMNPAQKIVKV